jgi:tetratricopeptide (TPR) repeat protein
MDSKVPSNPLTISRNEFRPNPNPKAWYALFAGNVTQADLENALKATQLNNKDTYAMHTLGCVYAELGKTKEAREMLIQAMDLENLDEPTPPYWYAFGRIAEQYGLRETASADYARVPKPKRASEVPGSSYRLAYLRSQAMNADAKGATKAGGMN